MYDRKHAPLSPSAKSECATRSPGDEGLGELHDTLGNQALVAQLEGQDAANPDAGGPWLSPPTQGTTEEQLEAWLAVAQAAADDLAAASGEEAMDLRGLLDSGQPLVIGLRGLGFDPETGAFDADTHETTMTRDYDDSFVVLRRDADGQPVVAVLQGSTHPTWEDSGKSPDVDGDGRNDAAMVRPGIYDVSARGKYISSVAGETPAYNVERHGAVEHAGRLPAWRDTEDESEGNSNNTITEEERRASETRMETELHDRDEWDDRQIDGEMGDYAVDVLFHAGEDKRNTGTGASSIGCQTMHPDTFREFMTALGEDAERVWPEGGSPRRTSQDFTYVLTDAAELLEAHPELREMLGPSSQGT